MANNLVTWLKKPAAKSVNESSETVTKVVKPSDVFVAADKEGSFQELPASEILPAASMDTQLDYAFYSLRKGVQARVTDRSWNVQIYVHWETRKTWSLV